jgi:hypothetical protein
MYVAYAWLRHTALLVRVEEHAGLLGLVRVEELAPLGLAPLVRQTRYWLRRPSG